MPGASVQLPNEAERNEGGVAMLDLKDIRVRYGGIEALGGISMSIPKGKIVTLIGSNGAGKSTTLRTITKLVKPYSGTVIYNGDDITALPTQEIVKRGITLVPEGRRVFPDLTVTENLKIGAYLRNQKQSVARDIDFIHELFPRLKERSSQLAGTLSGGEQQMLAVGRALMSRPKLMMMDEPSLGLAPLVIKDIFDTIKRVNEEESMTILLIEQNANAALKIAHYGYVLETGRIELEGPGRELQKNEKVKELYLGKANR